MLFVKIIFTVPFEDDIACTADPKDDYPFLASIIQNVYDDNNEEQRYLGAALILSQTWLISSAEVVKNVRKKFKHSDGIYVRAGSNYWSKEGTVHEIDKINHDIDEGGKETFLVFISVKEPFPKINTIIKLSRKSALEQRSGVFIMHGWKTSDDLPLEKRLKFKPSEKNQIRILSDNECDEVTGGLLNVFCGVEIVPSDMCTNDLGFPLVQDNFFMAVQVHEYCDTNKNKAIHIFRDLSVYYDRLVDLIKP